LVVVAINIASLYFFSLPLDDLFPSEAVI